MDLYFIFILKFQNSSIILAIKEFDSGMIHEDENLKCYMLCLFEKAGFLNDAGDLHIQRLIEHIEDNYSDEVQDIAMNMGKRCLRTQGDNQCERAFWFHKCWKTSDPRVKLFTYLLNDVREYIKILFLLSFQHYFLI